MRAWNITCSSRSPSSSRRCSRSPISTASITSWLSSSRYGRRERWVCRASHGQPPGGGGRRAPRGAAGGEETRVQRGGGGERGGAGAVGGAGEELDLRRLAGDGAA